MLHVETDDIKNFKEETILKRAIYRAFFCVLATALLTAPCRILALETVGVVDGRIINVQDPIIEQDAATKTYVDLNPFPFDKTV